jgi:hypothetical protein
MGNNPATSMISAAHRPVVSRRLLLGGALGATATLASTGPARAAQVMIIYVYADDCAPCQIFQAHDWPQFQASRLARSVRFVRTSAPKTTQAYQVKYWPSEARPFHSAVKVPIVPSFILVNSGQVVLVGNGIVGWRNQVLPQIHQLASR